MAEKSTLSWDHLDTDEEGTPVIEIAGERWRLPYTNLLPQTVSIESLEESIREEGIQYPIIVDEETDEVVDGMTRLYVAQNLDLPADDIPIERKDIGDRDDKWEAAISLDAQRRQITAPMRRDLIETIVDRKGWDEPREHVSDLARILGVHKSTVSRDVEKIYESTTVHDLKSRKRTLNTSLSGLRKVAEMVREEGFSFDLEDDEIEEYRDRAESLIELLDRERETVTERIHELESD